MTDQEAPSADEVSGANTNYGFISILGFEQLIFRAEGRDPSYEASAEFVQVLRETGDLGENIEPLLRNLCQNRPARIWFFTSGGYELILRMVAERLLDKDIYTTFIECVASGGAIARMDLWDEVLPRMEHFVIAALSSMAAARCFLHDVRSHRELLHTDATPEICVRIARTFPRLMRDCVVTAMNQHATASITIHLDQISEFVETLRNFLATFMAEEEPLLSILSLLAGITTTLNSDHGNVLETTSAPNALEETVELIMRVVGQHWNKAPVVSAAQHVLIVWLMSPYTYHEDSAMLDTGVLFSAKETKHKSWSRVVGEKLIALNAAQRFSRLTSVWNTHSPREYILLQLLLHPYVDGSHKLTDEAWAALEPLISDDPGRVQVVLYLQYLKAVREGHEPAYSITYQYYYYPLLRSRIVRHILVNWADGLQFLAVAINAMNAHDTNNVLSFAANINSGHSLFETLLARNRHPIQMAVILRAVETESVTADVLRLLLKHGAPIGYAADAPVETIREEKTPLQVAIENNRVDIIEIFNEHGADFNGIIPSDPRRTLDPGLTTPLNLAICCALRQPLQIVRHLLRFGAQVNGRHDSVTTPLMLAVKGREPMLDLVRLLLDNGADPCGLSKEFLYEHGPCADAALLLIGHGLAVESFILRATHTDDDYPLLSLLLDFGADPNLPHPFPPHFLPLHEAASKPAGRGLIRILLQYGAKVTPEMDDRTKGTVASVAATDPGTLQPTRGRVIYEDNVRKIVVPWTTELHFYTPRVIRATVRTCLALRESPIGVSTWGALPWELVEIVFDRLYQWETESRRAASRRGEWEMRCHEGTFIAS